VAALDWVARRHREEENVLRSIDRSACLYVQQIAYWPKNNFEVIYLVNSCQYYVWEICGYTI
jgi:hypothetical protein